MNAEPIPTIAQRAIQRGVQPYVKDGPLCFTEQGIYTVLWGSMMMEFDFVHVDHGDIWAEMEVVTSLPNLEGTLLRTRLNLIKGTTRREAVRDLDARTDPLGHEVMWSEMMEIASRYVVDRVREGEPAFMLRSAPVPETTDWLMEPLILGRRSTIWFGDGAGGKSLAAMAAAAAIQSGQALIGYQPSVAVPVAYLDWEWDGWEHRKRLEQLTSDQNIDLLYVPCSAPITEQTDRLRRLFREHGIKFIVVDSAVYACNGEPESADTAKTFFAALDSFGLGSLVIAHTTKNGTDDKPFGSQFWYAGARLIWLLKKQQEDGASALKLAFINKKSNTGPKYAPLALDISFDVDGMTIERSDWRDMPEVMDKLPLRKRIAYSVARGPKSYVELADELDTTTESVRKTIARYQSDFVHITRAIDRVTVIGLRSKG